MKTYGLIQMAGSQSMIHCPLLTSTSHTLWIISLIAMRLMEYQIMTSKALTRKPIHYLKLGIFTLSYTRNMIPFFFVKCKCKAEMKKAVEYKMRACIDDEGEILYAICGCPAGTGPLCSCKHFGAPCYLKLSLKINIHF